MRVVGLDGRTYPWPPPGRGRRADCSGPHLRARLLLEALFPSERRLEEVPLPGTGGLAADFYLPCRRTLVEVQGEQHASYVPFFHGGADGFLRSLSRDHRKRQWAELNNLRLVELPHDGTDDDWAAALLG